MMMPANYSAIAENEMTYVVGGGLLEAIGSVTAPVWGAANVKTFNTNLITIIGNQYVGKVLKGTLGNVFGGSYLVKTGEGDDAKRNTIFGKDKAHRAGFDVRAPVDREQGTRPAGFEQIAVAAEQRAGSGDLMLLSHWIASCDVYFSRNAASAACTRGRSTR